MAFKGRTTAGYSPTKGASRKSAMTGGKVGGNQPSTGRVLPASKSNVITKQTSRGVNPKNTRTNKLSANRVQRASGAGSKLNQQTNRAAKVITPRGTNPLNKAPFAGYERLRNSQAVPAGKGNIRNAGTTQKSDVARLRKANQLAMPPKAINGGGSFKGFIGQK